MLRKFILMTLIAALALLFCGKSCKRSAAGYKPNKAELGEDWEQFKHDASFNVWVFEGDRPAEHLTLQRARVFWNGDVAAEELSLIDEGLCEMLAACRQNTTRWNPGDIWTKFVYFQQPVDFKIVFVQSNYILQEGEAAGCAGMITGPHGVFTAAGTVGGLNDRIDGHIPGSKGGVYIVIPKQSPEQFARAECRNLMKNAVRNEAEHVWFTNDSVLYFAHANDGFDGNHPYCRPNETSAHKPIDLFDITDEQIREYERQSTQGK